MSKALSEFKRVLKPEGFLAVSTWGNDSELATLVNKEIDSLFQTTTITIKAKDFAREITHFNVKKENEKLIDSIKALPELSKKD